MNKKKSSNKSEALEFFEENTDEIITISPVKLVKPLLTSLYYTVDKLNVPIIWTNTNDINMENQNLQNEKEILFDTTSQLMIENLEHETVVTADLPIEPKVSTTSNILLSKIQSKLGNACIVKNPMAVESLEKIDRSPIKNIYAKRCWNSKRPNRTAFIGFEASKPHCVEEQAMDHDALNSTTHPTFEDSQSNSTNIVSAERTGQDQHKDSKSVQHTKIRKKMERPTKGRIRTYPGMYTG
jgi:hypothetical protein